MRRHPFLVATAVTLGLALSFMGGTAVARDRGPQPDQVDYNIPPRADGSVDPDPFLARGVGVGHEVSVYAASGTGPSPNNPLAPDGTPAALEVMLIGPRPR